MLFMGINVLGDEAWFLGQRFPNCSSWASSISNSRDIVQNANSWSHLRTTESETVSSEDFQYELKFENC